MNDLMAALEQFDITESNLAKLERLWTEMESYLPKGLSRGDDPEYDERRRAYDLLIRALPSIEGFKPEANPPAPDQVGASRIEYLELGEPGVEFAVDQWITEFSMPGDLQGYDPCGRKARAHVVVDATGSIHWDSVPIVQMPGLSMFWSFNPASPIATKSLVWRATDEAEPFQPKVRGWSDFDRCDLPATG